MDTSQAGIISKKAGFSAGILRITLGVIFLWAFFDKLFGLGFATTAEKSWLSGVSPTAGFLKMGTYGPFASFFHSLANYAIVDWLFMLGLFCIGTTLILGICTRLATSSATILLFLMWLSLLPPKNNPLIDEHIVYIFALQLLLQLKAGKHLGFGEQWSNTALVKKYSWLR